MFSVILIISLSTMVLFSEIFPEGSLPPNWLPLHENFSVDNVFCRWVMASSLNCWFDFNCLKSFIYLNYSIASSLCLFCLNVTSDSIRTVSSLTLSALFSITMDMMTNRTMMSNPAQQGYRYSLVYHPMKSRKTSSINPPFLLFKLSKTTKIPLYTAS
jgi:hypothetical protein